MSEESKLKTLFDSAYVKLKNSIHSRQKSPTIYIYHLTDEWKNYIDGLEGVSRKSKIVGLILQEKDEFKVNDPLSPDCVIIIKKEAALKILALGYLPEQQENTT